MGSRQGYRYRHSLSMVKEQDIKSVHKLHLINGQRALLFQIIANFTIKTRTEEEGATNLSIDRETFDAFTYKHEDEKEDMVLLSYTTEYRLEEYGMSLDEINMLIKEAVAFARSVSAKPENASLNLIPVVVHLEVCTVQQDGEPFDEVMDRAITPQKLVPLYLWPQPTAVKRKPMTGRFMNFLRGLDRIRVADIHQGLALMQNCHVCKRKPIVGAHITVLSCSHAFHSHCIVRWLEEVNVCPCCCCPAYDTYITLGPPFEHQRAAELE